MALGKFLTTLVSLSEDRARTQNKRNLTFLGKLTILKS